MSVTGINASLRLFRSLGRRAPTPATLAPGPGSPQPQPQSVGDAFRSAPKAPAGEREERRGGDRERRHQERLRKGRDEPDRSPPSREDFGQDRNAHHDAQGARQEREAARRALLSRRERGHDGYHVGDLEEPEPESRGEEGNRDHTERRHAVNAGE